MIKRLVEFLQNNFPNTNINDYLDSKFIELNSEQLKKIADAIKDGELSIKPASSCPADKFIFQFGTTIIFVNRDTSNTDQKYNAELAWETDFLLFTQLEVRPRVSTLLLFHLMMILISHLHQPIKFLKIRLETKIKIKKLLKKPFQY